MSEKHINPLDISQADQNELDLENWTCSAGVYENGKITCVVPELESFDGDNLQFNVDIALNGQQFTGKPLTFRYYDVQIKQICPNLGPSEGGSLIYLKGSGLYDSRVKRVRFEACGEVRDVSAKWQRKETAISCVVPPLTWLFGGEEVSEEVIEKTKAEDIKVTLTLNGQEWIDCPGFKFHDAVVERLEYVHNFGEDIEDEEEKEKAWLAEEAIPKPPAELETEEDIQKWKDEQKAAADESTEEAQTTARRAGFKFYIYGQNFLNVGENAKVKFTVGDVTTEANVIYKNPTKLAAVTADLGEEVEVGEHPCSVDITMNGQ